MRLRSNELCPIHKSLSCLWAGAHSKAQVDKAGGSKGGRPASPARISGTAIIGRAAETSETKDCPPGRDMRHLPRRLHGLQRCRPGPQEPERNGRSVAG
jgi:hypothetical protein